MKITLENIGRKFNSNWIFRNLNCEFSSGKSYAILGANGSGKSTLLQIIAGNISASEGNIKYRESNEKFLTSDQIFSHISFSSPHLELPEEMTFSEIVRFHFKFKKPFQNFSEKKIIELIELENAKEKQLKNFSSGMKQRVKLGLAILSHTPLLLLDEPASNLDKNAVNWYRNLMGDFSKNRLAIICSNHQENEFDFCGEKLLL